MNEYYHKKLSVPPAKPRAYAGRETICLRVFKQLFGPVFIIIMMTMNKYVCTRIDVDDKQPLAQAERPFVSFNGDLETWEVFDTVDLRKAFFEICCINTVGV